MTYTEPAYAKLNLTLDILGKLPDGYHDLRMVMTSITLQDTITLTPNSSSDLRLRSNASFLPSDDSNLAAKAARAFARETGIQLPGLDIGIQKEIPVCAGMAGGSSDAAAVLRLLRRLCAPDLSQDRLEAIGALVGSDVPYCVGGGTALVEGRGEYVSPLPPLPDCWLVVCKPAFPISTPELFGLVQVKKLRCHPDTAGMVSALERGDLEGVVHRLYNVFEEVLPRKYAQVFELKRDLLELGAMAASMSGSGPSVFGIFRDEETARRAADVMKQRVSATFLCRNAASCR